MERFEEVYGDIVGSVLIAGEDRPDRTGTGVLSWFFPGSIHHTFTYDDEGRASFPLLTRKRVPWKSVVAETLWFLQGRTDLESLRSDGCTWWDEWELEDGTIGRGYGHQLRSWETPDGETVDQLGRLIKRLKEEPYSRRHVLTMWNPGELDQMALPPCHGVYIQFYVTTDGHLDLHVHIRSSDLFLGLPTNIPSYALVQLLVAQVTGLKAQELIVTLGDAHLYKNHLRQVNEMLSRPISLREPYIEIDPSVENIDDFRISHINVVDYEPQSTIPAPVAV